jgi:hypothetical protein
MANTIGTGDPKDFDETRRLLYMALLRHRTEKYELAGTLVNALLHHHAVADDSLSAKEVMDHVVNVIEGEPHSRGWVKKQIRRISLELGD